MKWTMKDTSFILESYFDSQDGKKQRSGIKNEQMLVGETEEVFYSLMRVGMCKAILGQTFGEIIHAFLLAHHARPTRAEPLYHIARTYREILEMPACGYTFLQNEQQSYLIQKMTFCSSLQDTYT